MGSKVVVYILLFEAKESIRINIYLNQLVNGFEVLKWFDEMMAKGEGSGVKVEEAGPLYFLYFMGGGGGGHILQNIFGKSGDRSEKC